MKAVLDEIIRLGNIGKAEFDDKLAIPESSASKEELIELEKVFGNKVSPSFKKLLSIYNGIANFDWMDVSLLSTDYLIKNPRLAEMWEIAEWEAIDYRANQLFIFGESDRDHNLVAFDLTYCDSQGEHKVISFDVKGPIGEYENLEDYLTRRLTWFKDNFEKR